MRTFQVEIEVTYPAVVTETYSVTAENEQEAEKKVVDGDIPSSALTSYSSPTILTHVVLDEDVIDVEEVEELYESNN